MEFTRVSQVSTGVLFLLSCWNTALRPSLRREGIMLCFSMSQYMLVFMVPSMNCSSPVPAAHAASDHDTPTTMLDCRQDTLVFVHLTWLPPHTLDTIWTKYVYLGLIRPQDMVPVIHVLSLLVFSLRAFLYIIFRRGFLLGRQPCRLIFDAVCGVWSEHWQADPPTLSTSATMLAALIRLFPKHSLCIWRWARALNFFGRPWRGLFWVEPVLLNHCMVLATVLQLSFRPDNTRFNTPAPHSHLRPCNTNESHDTGERKWLIGPNLDFFT